MFLLHMFDFLPYSHPFCGKIVLISFILPSRSASLLLSFSTFLIPFLEAHVSDESRVTLNILRAAYDCVHLTAVLLGRIYPSGRHFVALQCCFNKLCPVGENNRIVADEKLARRRARRIVDGIRRIGYSGP